MNVFLKPNIVIEPLFCSWYLWTYLLPPHTAGLYLKNRHLKSLRSFLDSPELHQLAANNSKLVGGQFLNVSLEKNSQIKDLIAYTENKAQPLLTLANDIEKLDSKLQAEGKGYSLEHLYQHVPDSLRGCVEFVYDHNNHAKIHFFEKAIYDKFYNPNLQSVIFSPIKSDKRKFVLSTPRIPDSFEYSLDIAFANPLLSDMCHSRTQGFDPSQLMDQSELCKNPEWFIKNFFNDHPPLLNHNRNYAEEGVRVRYFGHACILLQSKDVSILVDPLISYFRPEQQCDRYTLDDLPDQIDYVLFTHNHLDHIAFESLIFLKNKVKHFVFPRSACGNLCDPDLKLILSQLGLSGLIPLDKMEGVKCSGGAIYSFPFLGEHGDLDIQSKCAFYVELEGVKFMFAADSNNLEPGIYEYIGTKVGKLDALFLGMECVGAPVDWIYGPLLSPSLKYKDKQSRRFSGSDAKRAKSLINILKSEAIYIYAMGQEPWLSHIMGLNYLEDSPQIKESNDFIADCKGMGQHAERLFGKFERVYNNR